MAELFGFSIERPVTAEAKREEQKVKQLIPSVNDDGAVEASATMGGAYGTYLDLEGNAKNQSALINRYRQMALQPECDSAIDDIVNESIDLDWKSSPVELNMDEVEESQSLKDRINEEFDEVMTMLDFQNKGYDIFRQWYIDGQIYFQLVIDHDRPSEGIKKIVLTDPRKIRKIRRQRIKKDEKNAGSVYSVPLYLEPEEFYIYNPMGIAPTGVHEQRGVKIAKDSIAHVTSGVVDPTNKMVMSHMHKAIKPLNNLRHMEDSSVIYRLARAPERRLFYLDVGNLPPLKADQYIRDMMNKYKNRLVYDAQTGAIRDDRRFLTMLEDFWLPRREGARGTEISTLPGGDNLGQITDIEYFQGKLYKALNVPVSRLQDDGAFNLGRPSEITRDEVKFNKFITRLRNRFSMLFDVILGRQLILKGVLNSVQWDALRECLAYDWRNDNHFTEFKEIEVEQSRIGAANEAIPLVGQYVSKKWVRKKILRQTEEEMEEIDKEKAEELEDAMQSGDMDGDGIPDEPPPEAGPGASADSSIGASPPKEKEEKPKKKEEKKDTKEISARGAVITRKKTRHKRHPITPE